MTCNNTGGISPYTIDENGIKYFDINKLEGELPEITEDFSTWKKIDFSLEVGNILDRGLDWLQNRDIIRKLLEAGDNDSIEKACEIGGYTYNYDACGNEELEAKIASGEMDPRVMFLEREFDLIGLYRRPDERELIIKADVESALTEKSHEGETVEELTAKAEKLVDFILSQRNSSRNKELDLKAENLIRQNARKVGGILKRRNIDRIIQENKINIETENNTKKVEKSQGKDKKSPTKTLNKPAKVINIHCELDEKRSGYRGEDNQKLAILKQYYKKAI